MVCPLCLKCVPKVHYSSSTFVFGCISCLQKMEEIKESLYAGNCLQCSRNVYYPISFSDGVRPQLPKEITDILWTVNLFSYTLVIPPGSGNLVQSESKTQILCPEHTNYSSLYQHDHLIYSGHYLSSFDCGHSIAVSGRSGTGIDPRACVVVLKGSLVNGFFQTECLVSVYSDKPKTADRCNVCKISRRDSPKVRMKKCMTCHSDYWSDVFESRQCKKCQSTVRSHTYNVMEVYNSRSIGKQKTPRSIPMGVELEVEFYDGNTRSKVLDEVSDCDSELSFKHDGTIRMERGVEVVSSPQLIDWHVSSKGWGEIYKNGPFESDRCGMHVHVPVCLFTEHATIARQMLYSQENRNFMVCVANRASTNMYGPFDGNNYRGSERYQGFNTTTKGNKTVEFRIFKTPIRKERFVANLEFVDSFCVWWRQVEKKPELHPSFMVNGYVDFLYRNQDCYKNLLNVLSRVL